MFGIRGENGSGSDQKSVIVIDLTAFPDLPKQLREAGSTARLRIVGFAPHVRVELPEAGAETCDEVLPRGAVARAVALLAQASPIQSPMEGTER
jgi:hypothetical protein